MCKLQSIQNVAARLITGVRLRDHITHVLRQLHWIPVRRRVDYKIACLAHQSLSGFAPAHLADDINLKPDSGRLLLQSAADSTRVVQHTNITCDDKSLSSASMEQATVSRQDISYEQFKWQLNTSVRD